MAIYMQSPLFLAVIFFVINLPFIIFYSKITKFVNVFDEPDASRKLHLKKTPLIGGVIIFYNLIFLFILFIFNPDILDSTYFASNRNLISFFLISIFLFLIGFYDDKYVLSPNTKLFTISLAVLLTLLIDTSIIITEINFSFTDRIFYLKEFSTFFTVLCFLLFINAFNMFDGINLQSGLYAFLIFFIFLFKGILYSVCIVFIISIFFFLILNYRNKTFLGDGGTYILSYIISYLFIKSYNLSNSFYTDEIFLIMIIPGLELIRLATQRLFIRQHPFKADRKHIHHLMINVFGYNKTLLFIQILIFIPLMLDYFLLPTFITIIISTIFYFSTILFLQKKKS